MAKRLSYLAGLLVVLLSAGTVHAQSTPPPGKPAAAPKIVAPPGRPHFAYKGDKGFIDDPFALDAATNLLAIVRTDSASFARLELIDLEAGKGTLAYDLGDPHQIFEHLLFAGAGRAMLLVTRDRSTGGSSVLRFDESGKPAGLVGPATDVGFTVRGGKKLLLAWDRGGGERAGGDKERTAVSVTVYEAATLTKVGKTRGLTIEAGLLKKPAELKIVSWVDGYARIVGQRPGEYDKKRDIRLPDRAAAFDVLDGTFAWEREIADVVGWAAVSQAMRKTPQRTAFVALAADQASLDVIDVLGRRTPLGLALPLAMYDLRSLVELEDDEAGELVFSFALDPLNPDALARRKADKPFLDLYATKLPSAETASTSLVAARHLLRTPLDERPIAWARAGGFAAILRKHKSFSRGGAEIEVFRIVAP